MIQTIHKRLHSAKGWKEIARLKPIVVLFLGSILLVACKTAPYTERSQLIMVSAADEARLGLMAYRDILKKEKVSKNASLNQLVRKVGQRIATASDRKDMQWEFNLIESKQANAFCLPGGKIAIYTGLLPITRDEAGLAAIMGHEVAHALARHSAERLSHNMLTQGALFGANVALSTKKHKQQGNIMAALGLGLQYGILLPFSRKHESEADRIGLVLMAKAGYDPRKAIGVWQRMKQSHKGKKQLEFLSTHPSDETRIRQLRHWMPEAMKYYKAR